MNGGGLSVDIPDPELKWTLKRAAVAKRTTLRELVGAILAGWLAERGYVPSADDVRDQPAAIGE